jgi:DNA-binding transcriptional LysR family regulator
MIMDSLREFVVFSKHLNISAAARELNLSQPTLSKHIAEIEREIGCSLIVHGNQLSLTPAGKLLLNEAGDLMNHFEATINKCRDIARSVTNAIRIQDPISFEAFNRAIYNSIEPVSDITLSTEIIMVSTKGYTATDAIKAGIVDIAFAFICPNEYQETLGVKGNIVYIPIASDRLQVQMEANNPLAKMENISFADLQSTQILVPANKIYDDWREIVHTIFSMNQATPNFSMRVVSSINEFRSLPLRDLVLICSSGSAQINSYSKYLIREISSPKNQFYLCAICRNDNPIASALAKQMGAGFEFVD